MLVQVLLSDPFTTFFLIIDLIRVVIVLGTFSRRHVNQFSLFLSFDLLAVLFLPVCLPLSFDLFRTARLAVLSDLAPLVIRVDGGLALPPLIVVTVLF